MGTESHREAADWAAATAGDSAAFGRVFDAHRDRVFGQALRLIRDPHDAEDVTALVFLEAWRKRSAVRVVDGSVIGWLLVTTNHVVRNLERSTRRYRAVLERIPKPSVSDHPDPAEAVGDRLDQNVRDAQVRDAFSRLTEADQNVMTLCVLEELTMEQAAQVLGVPAGTVKSRLSRAKARLAVQTSELFDGHTSVTGGVK
ncbi:sigma-70 family RNA polymerase sigma factor [Herbiconiux sp. CPCC 205763]|uniref:Sigma-70 family RNA polymerase sigma factor n=1 Tax=Herbiconiux aconitum TaxID=2970913 RepID=A0ABT2GV80_9MICO|nr:sigma-70 family RNA polymerase sigma factor [Herbiconiux aconitum]MCS5720051.1 sigma-70 family RNA polymerase sigma factor [Herbiconiux aconitum]